MKIDKTKGNVTGYKSLRNFIENHSPKEGYSLTRTWIPNQEIWFEGGKKVSALTLRKWEYNDNGKLIVYLNNGRDFEVNVIDRDCVITDFDELVDLLTSGKVEVTDYDENELASNFELIQCDYDAIVCSYTQFETHYEASVTPEEFDNAKIYNDKILVTLHGNGPIQDTFGIPIISLE